MESEDSPDRRLKIGGYKMLDMHLQDPSRFYKKALSQTMNTDADSKMNEQNPSNF
jgi:hypothetical protein